MKIDVSEMVRRVLENSEDELEVGEALAIVIEDIEEGVLPLIREEDLEL